MTSPQRVVVTTYPYAFFNPGGGEIQILETVANVKALGIGIDIYSHLSKHISEYSVVHHFSVHGGSEHIIEYIKRYNKRLVISPTIWLDEPDKYPTEYIRQLLSLADMILPNSKMEMDQLRSYFNIPEEKFTVIYNGVDPCYAEPADPHIFKTVYSVDNYILCVGMIEERKNQLRLIEALKDYPDPVVFVGNYRDRQYYDLCRRAAPSHFRFVPYLPPKSEILRSAFQSCRLYVQPSLLETPGLSVLESAVSGKPVVVTEGGSTREYLKDLAIYVNPYSLESLREGIQKGLQEKEGGTTLRSHILENFMWPTVVKPLITVYQNLG
ncbi:glycosyltransferase [Candidatus Nitrospira bockiana]